MRGGWEPARCSGPCSGVVLDVFGRYWALDPCRGTMGLLRPECVRDRPIVADASALGRLRPQCGPARPIARLRPPPGPLQTNRGRDRPIETLSRRGHLRPHAALPSRSPRERLNSLVPRPVTPARIRTSRTPHRNASARPTPPDLPCPEGPHRPEAKQARGGSTFNPADASQPSPAYAGTSQEWARPSHRRGDGAAWSP